MAIGFSAGGHLVALGSAGGVSKVGARPDAQVLVYPSIEPDEWLDEEMAGFWDVNVTSPQVRSLMAGREKLVAGPAFVAPPPTFLVASTEDECCPPEKHSGPYAAAARAAGTAALDYLVDDFGCHGFGLKDFWTGRCVRWLEGRGFGRPAEGGAGPS